MPAEPTYATPRTPERYSDGPMIGAQIAKWQGRRPTYGQQRELDVALERVDGPGSPYAYDEVIVIKGRRCGKTVTAFGVPLIRALAGPVTLPNGRRLPFRGVHVAQNISSAQQRFGEDLVRPFERRFTEIGWKRAARDLAANGNTRLIIDPRVHKNIVEAERLQVASELRVLAPTGNSARGAGVFHRTYDEELTYPFDKGRELAAAGRPTMAELYGHGQTWHVSNVSTETDARKYLWHQREKGRRAVAEDRRTGVCYFEYSVPPDEDPDDERVWFRRYPALGDGLVGISQLRADQREFNEQFGPGTFAAEYLGRWPDEGESGMTGWEAFDEQQFIAAGRDHEQPVDVPAALGVDLDIDRRCATITALVGDYAEIIDHRPGVDWVRQRVLELAGSVVAIGIDDYGAGHELLDQLAGTPAEDVVIRVRGQDLFAACYALEAGIEAGTATWRRNGYAQQMIEAAAAAVHTTGRAWQYDRKVDVPQTPILAWVLAGWALRHQPALMPDPAIY